MGNGIAGVSVQLFNVLKETVNRVLKIPEFLLYLLGIRPFKLLRLRVVILRDERGLPLAHEELVMQAVHETTRIFASGAQVKVIPSGWLVVTAPHAAPKAALEVNCDRNAWREDMGQAGAFYRSLMARTPAGTAIGYGAPVTVFLVRDVAGKAGCSLGPLTDYATLEANILQRGRRLLAHEIGHACGLFHSKVKSNFMFPVGPGDKMSRWQAAVLRTSRHVTYL
jgi:hypothetical protein